MFVIDSQYLLAIPKRYADHIAQQLSIKISPLPFEVPNYQVKLYWHKTRNNDPENRMVSGENYQLLDKAQNLKGLVIAKPYPTF